jgi:hypothetical protein
MLPKLPWPSKHVARGEVLRHAHHRVIHGGVAVGVELAQHVAHDTYGFAERLVRRKAQLDHCVKDAAVHGLQAVAHVRQGAVDDRGHGVGDEGFLHLVFQVYRNGFRVADVEFH